MEHFKAVPKGTAEFEAKRVELIRRTLDDKIPPELRVSHIIGNESPPTNVSDIPHTCGLLTAEELEITDKYDAVGLAEAVAARKYTAVAVTTAFSKRAIIAHQLTCCLTQIFMDEAIKQAECLDNYLAQHGKTVGPLHGVPISIKEHIPVKGTFSSDGYFGSIVENTKDCHMIEILRSLGAVFYCKTNQPQSLMHLESDSHWGRVLNPFNIRLSAGGSTGGEAALVAMKGSVLGVGTDIGGSVRGPSAFCGIYGFKPTTYTLPMKNFLQHPFPAELNILVSTGPMCRSLRDMDLFMRVVLAASPHLRDTRLIPIPWTGLNTPLSRPLKVGVMRNDGTIQPQPPVKRAIAWAAEKLAGLASSGSIQVKDFRPYGAAEAWSKIRRMYWPDGGKSLKDAISSTGEPIHPLTDWIVKDAEPLGMQNVLDVSSMREERDDFRYAFAESWNAQDVDVVVCPAFVGPACAHDTALYWTYTSLWNFVDYPGVVFPTPIKAEAGEKYDSDYVPLSDACQHVKELWESTNFEEAPIDLQIVARRHHDNQLFGALELLKDAFKLL